ncbi:MAG TPA: hypothetical protein VJY62_08730, partial [Bacteroidia bacterium]|nr:hypothetical protein [Bacteroidia bacterium]
MNTIKISTKPKISDPNFLKFRRTMRKLMLLSIQQSIGAKSSPVSFKYKPKQRVLNGRSFNSVGDVVAGYLDKLPQEKKTALIKGVTSKNFYAQEDTLDLFTHVDTKSVKSVFEQIDVSKEFSFINSTTAGKTQIENIGNHFSWLQFDNSAQNGSASSSGAPKASATVPNPIKELQFRLHSVSCVDETGKSEWTNHDKIGLSGITINDKGTEQEISEFTVSDTFDDGDTKTYSTPRVLRKFTVDTDYSEPKIFSAFLLLAEIDAGGFGDFIDDLYKSVKDEIDFILKTLGAAAGGLIGTALGGIVGTAVGGALGLAFG